MTGGIRNIVFDWGGVLLDLDIAGCARAFEEAGVQDVPGLLSAAGGKGFLHAYECGNISTAAFREEVRRVSKVPLADGDIDRLWCLQVLSIPQEKLRLLVSLSHRYNLYLLSNTNEIHWDYLSSWVFQYEGEDVRKCFKGIFLSFRMHLAKPDERIFRRMAEDAAISPGETLFVDDAEANCRAASATGLRAVHYVPGADLGELFREVL